MLVQSRQTYVEIYQLFVVKKDIGFFFHWQVLCLCFVEQQESLFSNMQWCLSDPQWSEINDYLFELTFVFKCVTTIKLYILCSGLLLILSAMLVVWLYGWQCRSVGQFVAQSGSPLVPREISPQLSRWIAMKCFIDEIFVVQSLAEFGDFSSNATSRSKFLLIL